MASLRSGTVRAGASRLEALRMRQCWLSAPCMPFGSHKSYKAPCQDKSALTVIGRPCRVNANFVALDLRIGIPKHLRAQRRALPASGDGPAEGALPACRRGRERLAAGLSTARDGGQAGRAAGPGSGPPQALPGRGSRCERYTVRSSGQQANHTPRSSKGLGTPWHPCCRTWV